MGILGLQNIRPQPEPSTLGQREVGYGGGGGGRGDYQDGSKDC